MSHVLLVAEEAAGVQTLKLLARSAHEVVAVLSTSAAAREAERLGLAVEDPALVREATFAARAGEVDLLLNVHSLHVAAPEVVAAPRTGSFNLHPGPLPEYAGLNAPSWAIYDGRDEHAATLHWMEAEVDAGAVAYSAEFPIEPDDTGFSLSARCVEHGLPLIERLLADVDAGRIPRHDQDAARRGWHGRESPHGGRLPWTLPAQRVVDLVRAADYSPFDSPWGHPSAMLGDRELEFVRVARTGDAADEPAGTIREGGQVAAADEWVQIERVKEGGRRIDPANDLQSGSRFKLHPQS